MKYTLCILFSVSYIILLFLCLNFRHKDTMSIPGKFSLKITFLPKSNKKKINNKYNTQN